VIPSGVRVFVCTQPVDLRRSFDGLAQAARERLGTDPMAGGLFVFVSRRRSRLKMIWFDRRRWTMLYLRLHGERFVVPDGNGAAGVSVDGGGLARLLEVVERVSRRGP
jgi:transposase